MITNFDKYKQEKFVEEFGFKYEELVQQCEYVFGDVESAKDEVEWYLNTLMNLYYNGGEIYRIVTLRSQETLNKNNLGNHWVMDEGQFVRVYDNIEQEFLNMLEDDEDEDDHNWLPYVVTATIKSKSINIKFSIEAFKELPEEGEIYIENGTSEFVSIKEYR